MNEVPRELEIEGYLLQIKRIGNSLGFILPKDLLARLNLKEGDKLYVIEQTERGIKLSPYDPKHAKAMEIARRSFRKYADTYKALAELGKVAKTIYLCEYLSSIDLRYEVQEGLNVVERWNEANDFRCYGRQGIWTSNSRDQQEVTTLALQLLQNCLMLINTVLIEQTIAQHHLLDQLSAEDRRGLTPLFYGHVNPYGLFALALDQPSFLEAA